MRDYYGENGCCKTCPEEEKQEHLTGGISEGGYEECLCYACKCRKCDGYGDGECLYD